MRVLGEGEPRLAWEPLHSAHAIEQTVFFAQFDRPVDDQRMARLAEISGHFSDELPRRSHLQTLSLSFGAPGPLPVQQGGLVLQRIASDGSVESEIRVDRAGLAFRTSTYTRWVKVWGQSRRYFAELMPVYAEQSSLATVGMSYIDKFIWSGQIAECDGRTLMRRGSPYLAPQIFDTTDLWHSHSGAFSRHNVRTKRLVNLNADYADDFSAVGSRRVVNITTAITDSFNQPGYDRTDVAGNLAVEVYNTHIEGLHVLAKDVLGHTIDEAMVRRIDLWTE